nr:MAG TPA: hypothetical protein [Caudoviricetes sp.]
MISNCSKCVFLQNKKNRKPKPAVKEQFRKFPFFFI